MDLAPSTIKASPSAARGLDHCNGWLPPGEQPSGPDDHHLNRVGRQLDRDQRARAATILLLVPLRIFLAAGWLRAGVEKLISSDWWNGHELHVFLAQQHAEALPFWRPVIDHAVSPSALFVAALVCVGELGCGLMLATGQYVRAALAVGLVLNVAFVLCGVVNPSAFYLVMEFVLVFATPVLIERPAAGHGAPRFPLVSVAWCAAAAAFIPFIRTLDPANVIGDPAAMLAFLSFIVGISHIVRWNLTSADTREGGIHEQWTRKIETWLGVRSRPHQPRRRSTDRAPHRLALAPRTANHTDDGWQTA